ncbi:DUF7103 family protein [Flavitalea sp.]|nr:hypothetical protein [Flavitalea sp.]
MYDLNKMVTKFLRDDLKTFRAFQVVIACICILIPLLLRWSDKDTFYPNKPPSAKIAELDNADCGYDPDTTSRICKDKLGFRASLSDYVYSSNSYIFGILYCMAAMLFIFNGAVYFKCEKYLKTNHNGRWYNIALGVFLIAVILNPQHQRPFWHYAFTILFFVGNVIVIAFLHQRKNRIISIILAMITVLAMILALIPSKIISILLAEWISLTAIAIYLILEAVASKRYHEETPDARWRDVQVS